MKGGVALIRPQWVIGLVILAVAVIALPTMAQDDGETQTPGEEVAFEPVGELMHMIGSAEEAEKETVAKALRGFMDSLLSFLEEKGVPDTALSNIESNFNEALEEFLADRTSADEFGTQMATTARQMATEAQLQGVSGVPSDVLEQAGIPADVVDEMAGGNVPDEAQIPEVAESAAEEAGPPEEEEQGPPDDEDEGQEGPPDDDEQGPPDDEDEGQDGPPDDNEQGPPDDNDDGDDNQGPPDDAGPPDDDEQGPPDDGQGGPPGN